MLKRLLFALFLVLCASKAWAANPCASPPCKFYVSYTSGNDSNSGLDTAHPWKYLPNMEGTVAGTGPGYYATPEGGGICNGAICNLAGYSFILKGGDTWPRAAFNTNVNLGGMYIGTYGTGGTVGSTAVYYGVDQTWYIGGSWTRPIFNTGGIGGGAQCFATVTILTAYVILDNIEFTGLYWDSSCQGGSPKDVGYLAMFPAGNIETKNIYFHGWAHDTYAHGTGDQCHIVQGDTQGGDTTSSLHDSVIDGSDSLDVDGNASCDGTFGGPPVTYNVYFKQLTNASVVNYPVTWSQNTCDHIGTYFDPNQHNQCFESNANRDSVVANNLVHDISAGIVMQLSPIPNYTTWFYNNVVYNINGSGDFVVCSTTTHQPGDTGGTCRSYNNTLEKTENALMLACASYMDGCYYKNDHFIGPGAVSTYCLTSDHCYQDHNTFQLSTSIANANGYSASTPFPYFPTLSSGATVQGNPGTDLSSSCATVPALCITSTVGVAYNTGNHTVIAPNNAGSAVNRDFTNTGAYQFAGGTPSLSSVSPNYGVIGATISVTLSGTSTSWVNGTTANFGSGITVNSTTCATTTSCVASITISSNATLGYRTVTMSTGESSANAFQVQAQTATGGGRLRFR